MADAKSKSTKSSGGTEIVPESVRKAVEAIAKGIGVAATELWTIFVRQYIVRGVSELFTALVLYGAAFSLRETIGLWALIPAGIGMAFTYGAIAYLGNPKYYALADITKRIQEFKDGDNTKSTSNSYRF
jgi:hypothetical protein